MVKKTKYLVAHRQSELVVGKVYSVCHVRIRFNYRNKDYLIPVNPNLHSDPQFGAGFEHYHIDGRFGIKAEMKRHFAIDKQGLSNHAVIKYDTQQDKMFNYEVIELVYIKKRCLRLTTGTKPPLQEYNKRPSRWMEWYKTMIGKSCKGRKCPHRGTIMIKDGDKLLCPLHNLIGCANTEKIIPYKAVLSA